MDNADFFDYDLNIFFISITGRKYWGLRVYGSEQPL